MVKHVIFWTLKDEFSEKEKAEIKRNIKERLEGLKGKIEGILEIEVQTEGLSTSNVDLMLDSSFESEEALAFYASHPLHVKVAEELVKPFASGRFCLDFKA